jgi:SpoVK/Ycf46/Vps4 family AAA+-type ATPase
MSKSNANSKLPTIFSNQLTAFCVSLQTKSKADTKGIHILLVGLSPAETEKAIKAIAAQLHLTLRKVAVSKGIKADIGETEKNLNQLFGAAEQARELLFFDEADALFGKRGDVKDLSNRYFAAELGFAQKVVSQPSHVIVAVKNAHSIKDTAGFVVFSPK